MKGQTAVEYLTTYGWAFLVIVIVLAVLFELGVFSSGTQFQTSASVVGFNTFNVNRFLVRSLGNFEMSLTNMLEDTVTIREITVDGSPLTNPSPALPFNLTAGANFTITANSSFTGTAGSLYTAKMSIRFDVDRGTADHLDAGLLKDSYQPG
ncbi:MAG: hypothetical protein Q7T16_03720 [Candidatus Burarchaeum sp.]|nr:hypothetical protein [Candidatus Burarchaeum sp.]MDO8339740.1 hypothetical protein [Candidatus Burarchaeum sp.]